jgi:hypothetical protein
MHTTSTVKLTAVEPLSATAAIGPPPSIPPAAGSTVARVAYKLMAVGAGRGRQPRRSADRRAHQQSHDRGA